MSKYDQVLAGIVTDREALSVPCDPVDRAEGEAIARELKSAAQVLDTGKKLGCAGLAANQLGHAKRVLVIKKGKRFKSFINPVLIAGKGYAVSEEGCFSFPGQRSKVMRFTDITVKADNTIAIRLKKREAIAFQHELDHLEGKCI